MLPSIIFMVDFNPNKLPIQLRIPLTILQRDYVDALYLRRQAHKSFRISEGYPRFFFRVLTKDETDYVPVTLILEEFTTVCLDYPVVLGSRWRYEFYLSVLSFFLPLAEIEVSLADVRRVAASFMARRLYSNRLWRNLAYIEELGPDNSPDPTTMASTRQPDEVSAPFMFQSQSICTID